MSRHQLIVGGQRSGKSGHAQRLAAASDLQVTVVATAMALDEEMAARIARHKRDRPTGFSTVEAPLALNDALRAHAQSGRLLVVDCLTLWLTNWLMPMNGPADVAGWERERQKVLDALPRLPSPVLFISNEVGWGSRR